MKGQFYSIVAILIAIPIFIFIVQYTGYSNRIDETISDRIVSDQISQLVSSIELDTTKAMEISGRRSVLEATNFVINSGEPLSDAVGNITTLMTTGTINGSYSFLLENNTMPNWSQRISAKPVNFDVVLEYGNISVENNDGYSLKVGMDINITVSDSLGKARLERRNVRNYVTISLVGLEDPMFPLNTQGFVRRTIRKPPLSDAWKRLVSSPTYAYGGCAGPVTFNTSEDDDTKILVAQNLTGVVFSRHLGIILDESDNLSGQIGCYFTGNASAYDIISAFSDGSGSPLVYMDGDGLSVWSAPAASDLAERYYYSAGGPDFLQRLEGDYTYNPDGLSTFIYVPEFEEQALPVKSRSRVAYRYFSDVGSCSQVNGMPAWFGMDSTDASRFGVGDLLTATPCESES